jgi:hypothetical protein
VFGVRPDSAVGLAGTAHVWLNVGSASSDDLVTVEPTGGLTPDDSAFVAPIASGLPVQLGCYIGLSCFPSGGSIALGGGFDLAFEDHHASIANLVLTTSGSAPDALYQTLTGTLNGAPVTLVTKGPETDGQPSFTSDFAQRAGAALGTDIVGNMDVALLFTSTGPA